MHFQIIRDDYYNAILERINKYFPEFNSVFDREDGVYPVLGELSVFIIENFKNEKIRKSTVTLINEPIEEGGAETENAIVLQLFQKFYEDIYLSNQIRELLRPKALSIFNKYFEDYNK